MSQRTYRGGDEQNLRSSKLGLLQNEREELTKINIVSSSEIDLRKQRDAEFHSKDAMQKGFLGDCTTEYDSNVFEDLKRQVSMLKV